MTAIVYSMVESSEVRVERKKRRWAHEEKCRIVKEKLVEGRSVAQAARAHQVNANQVFDWRKQYHQGLLGTDGKDVVNDSAGTISPGNMNMDSALLRTVCGA
ncbi:hypothetical protein AX768_02450 [Burkholderia sp. PAMC 28687]|uniref:transposase n=1 Tax=Burkholderia sp. PAMC 28687 TaxID=1795874 RepID=UPI000784F836|nr:transposase [Burkholderia sp. PAMC 28687]AMM13140.1 hypothetical protein AX768_02450 [Burkholderia sp. PAMC 28687]